MKSLFLGLGMTFFACACSPDAQDTKENQDPQETPDRAQEEQLEQAETPEIMATIRYGLTSPKENNTTKRALTKAEALQVLAFMKSAEKTHVWIAKTPPPTHVYLDFEGHRLRCGIEGSWMLDMNNPNADGEYVRYGSRLDKALWSVDLESGKLTFLE